MFYCDACAKKNRWPIGLVRSSGACEVCGKKRECSDVSSSKLPDPDRSSTTISKARLRPGRTIRISRGSIGTEPWSVSGARDASIRS